MSKKHRIMHGIIEIAGQNYYSVLGLKYIGEKAETVICDKHPFVYQYDRCLNISRDSNSVLKKSALLFGFYLVSLFRYDIYHFHFGNSILKCYELWTYVLLQKKLFFEYHGSDVRDYKKACPIMGITFDESMILGEKQREKNAKICKIAKGIIVHDDELIPYLPKIKNGLYVVPLRVDLSRFTPHYPKENNDSIRIVHAPSKRALKGTKYLLDAFENLKKKYANIELVLVEGKTQEEAIKVYMTADIIVDQLCIGTYGVFSVESMALGKPVITYINDEMKKRFPEELPIVSGNKDKICETLEYLINNPTERRILGIKGREYVENYHDYRVLAILLKEIYDGKAKQLTGRDAFARVKCIKEKMEM